jgi:hypothetical protein
MCLVILRNFVAAASARSIPPKFAVPLTNQTLSPGGQLTLESTVTGTSAEKKSGETFCEVGMKSSMFCPQI